MDKIMSFLKNFELGDVLPDASTITNQMRTWLTVFMLIGPVLLIILGVWFYFFPRKLMNDEMGFCGLFRTKHKKAWQYSQALSGLCYGILGIVLLIIYGIMCLGFGDLSTEVMAMRTVVCVSIEVALVFIIWVVVQVLTLLKKEEE